MAYVYKKGRKVQSLLDFRNADSFQTFVITSVFPGLLAAGDVFCMRSMLNMYIKTIVICNIPGGI